ncbi:hypothetical protein [Cryobacterium sp. TMT4-31]|uniref:hypothetical protein n=1 Tax=Cryobacterium sp. TMT4-31 TaxID=1259259 RepID=UPI001069B7D2|nr:hypothetical protein [Cryobacterium sp. TMT4-31]TFC91417.1 hypothetical protein E3T19_03760 [Cryobacterium sp. TMT4-31]
MPGAGSAGWWQDVRINDGSLVAQARRDDDPYERALTDPDFLRAVTAAHRGHWPVLDALWWCRHPAEAAPSGSPSPVARLSSLQRRLFAADGDAAGDGAVADAVRELEAEIGEERANIGAALAAAHAGREPPDTESPAIERPGTESSGTEQPATELPATGTPFAPHVVVGSSVVGSTPRWVPPRRRLLLGAGLVGALLLGALVGSQVTSASRSGAPEPTPTATSTRTPTVPVLAAQVFARVQTGQDIPRVPLPGAYDPASFRYLGSSGWRDVDANGVTDSPYYAARGASNTICLVAMPEGAGYLTTCTLEADFPRGGLRLSWQSSDVLPVEENGRTAMVMDITVTWMRDSTIETRGTGRALVP